MLRLVHPAQEGQPTRPPKGRRSPALSLTPEEVRHLRTAIKNTARAYGGAAVLASVLGVTLKSLHLAAYSRRHLSGTLAIRVAKAAGIHVEAILGGHLSEVGRCKACGARAAGGAS